MLRLLLAGVALAVTLCGASPAAAAGRVALVVGIGNYEHATALPNPSHDAAAIARSLAALGFEVIEGADLTKSGFDQKVQEFAKKSFEAEVALFFYAGHGIQVNGVNYLIPADAKLEAFTDLEFETVMLDVVLKYASGPDRIALAFIDACRDNPFVRSLARGFDRSAGDAQAGLAPPQLGAGGMLIAYATSPGATAADGDGYHSPFTEALLASIGAPGIEVQQMMTRVKSAVYDRTQGGQEPWHNTSLRQEFYFSAPPELGLATAPGTTPDELLWTQIAASGDVDKYRVFVDTFPTSPHVAEAVARIQEHEEHTRTTTAYDGTLSPDDVAYLVVADGTIGRHLPDVGSPSKVVLSARAQVQASGRVAAGDAEDYRDDWVQITASDGTRAFVVRNQLVRVDNIADYDDLISDLAALEKLFDRVEQSSGQFSEFAGTWGTAICRGADFLGINYAADQRYLLWEEDGVVFFAKPTNPTLVHQATYRAHSKMSLKDAGSVQFYSMEWSDGSTNLFGFKGDHFYVAENAAAKSFGVFNRCASGSGERVEIRGWYEKWTRAEINDEDPED
jgi:hypothetical protein